MTSSEGPGRVIAYPAGAGAVRTRVLEAGSGDHAVLMLHGVGARADRWMANLPGLAAAGLHTYAVDFPGHGFAEKGPALHYSVASFAEFVLELMDTLQLSSCSLVGTSLGGHVAARIAVDAPDRVRSLTLVGPMGMVPTGIAVRRALAQSIVDTSREGIADKLRVLVYDDALVTDSWIDEEWRINNSPGTKEAFTRLAEYFEARIDEDVVGPRLGQLPREIPMQLVWGSEDVLVPTEFAYAALKVLPAGTELQFIEAAGHAPYLERPDMFTSTMLEFFDRHVISIPLLT